MIYVVHLAIPSWRTFNLKYKQKRKNYFNLRHAAFLSQMFSLFTMRLNKMRQFKRAFEEEEKTFT